MSLIFNLRFFRDTHFASFRHNSLQVYQTYTLTSYSAVLDFKKRLGASWGTYTLLFDKVLLMSSNIHFVFELLNFEFMRLVSLKSPFTDLTHFQTLQIFSV